VQQIEKMFIIISDIPSKNVMYVEKGLETRVFISDRDFYSKLSYKELRVVFAERHSQGKRGLHVYSFIISIISVSNLKFRKKMACGNSLLL
jgi:hypothetical protein